MICLKLELGFREVSGWRICNGEMIMGLFDKMFGNGKKQICSKDVIDIMIAMADAMMDQGDYERAVDTYKNILELEPNITAQYNLGSLYAQGKGVPQNFLEGAYWFRQANMAGDEQAGKLCIKCMMDYAHSNFSAKTPKDLFDDMIHFVTYIYPKKNAVQLAGENLYDLGTNHLNKKEFDSAAKFLRSAAEFGNHGGAQNYLAVLYNIGAGVEKDDMVSLYWFDRAADNNFEAAKQDQKGMLNAYRTNFSREVFYETMQTLARRCAMGDADIPTDMEKADFWRKIGEGR